MGSSMSGSSMGGSSIGGSSMGDSLAGYSTLGGWSIGDSSKDSSIGSSSVADSSWAGCSDASSDCSQAPTRRHVTNRAAAIAMCFMVAPMDRRLVAKPTSIPPAWPSLRTSRTYGVGSGAGGLRKSRKEFVQPFWSSFSWPAASSFARIASASSIAASFSVPLADLANL